MKRDIWCPTSPCYPSCILVVLCNPVWSILTARSTKTDPTNKFPAAHVGMVFTNFIPSAKLLYLHIYYTYAKIPIHSTKLYLVPILTNFIPLVPTVYAIYTESAMTHQSLSSRRLMSLMLLMMMQGRHFLKMIGRALMLIFTTSKPFLPCNAIGIMLKFRNYW